MPSRRLSSNSTLAPVQEIAVNPYSSYNSDNVNMLSRMVTGQKNRDFISKGLDVRGNNRVPNEVVAGAPIINATFPDLSSYTSNWNVGIGSPVFVWDSITSSVLAEVQTGHKTETAILQATNPSWLPIISDIGYWFKVQFTLVNTPKRLFIQYGSESKIYETPTSGNYSFYIQLYNNANTFDALKFVVFLDDQDPYSDHSIYLDNIVLTKILNRGTMIDPISVPEVENPDTDLGVHIDPTNIPLAKLHPHESLKVYPGVCIKDEAMINMLGVNPNDSDTAILTLTYNDPNSWISGTPFGPTDFPVSATTYYNEDGTEYSAGFDANGVLTTTLWDDGENPGHYRKIKGQSGAHTNPAIVQWAYVVLYYSFFKNPDPNKAYIGLAKPSEINDPRYGEDYMILAKVRFIDVNTVDAIIYYPERKDWGFIDATNVTYLYLSQLKHWNDKPTNVSIALDLLASRIYNFKGVLFFPTHQQFKLWEAGLGGSGTGTGNGPIDFLQWLGGMDADNGWDLMAFVVESNTFWRSRIQLTGTITTIEIVDGGSGYGTVPTVRINSNDKNEAYESGTATISGGKVTGITYVGSRAFTTIPDIEIIHATGTGAKARANLAYSTSNYKVIVNWLEVAPKRFEVDYSLVTGVSTYGWPTAQPTNWTWHRLSDGGAVITTPITWVGDAAGLIIAQNAWPNAFYIERSIGPGNYTIVNPYNPTGRGTVPGPKTDRNDVKFNKFLRADGTWQPTRGGTLLVQNYLEFNRWYNASNSSYTWDVTFNTLEKTGRVPEIDYGVLIFVVSDSTWWRTPQNPTEYNGTLGTGWLTWTGGNDINGVPTCIKRMNNEFEVRWGREDIDWAISGSWTWANIVFQASTGKLTYTAASGSPAATLAQARDAFPAKAFIVTNPDDPTNKFRIVNPYNPSGNNLVRGPVTSDITATNKYLRADGEWANAGSQDLHFEAKGYLSPTDNLVQGMCGHNGVLEGVHVWTDTPINVATNGLKVDVLLTKYVATSAGGAGATYITASIFSDTGSGCYDNAWGYGIPDGFVLDLTNATSIYKYHYVDGSWVSMNPGDFNTGTGMPHIHS